VASENLPIIVIQRTCRECRKPFKIHCHKPYVTSPTPQFFGIDCPYCAEPQREELPGAIFRIEKMGRQRDGIFVLAAVGRPVRIAPALRCAVPSS
jgi:hypothetical protein